MNSFENTDVNKKLLKVLDAVHCDQVVDYDQLLKEIDGHLEQGANVDIQNKNGKSLLFYAFQNKNEKLIEYLQKKGADINLKDTKGNSILHDVCNSENVQLELVKLLLEKKADPNLANEIGNTPFHCAVNYASQNQVELVELLLQRGADPNKPSEFGVPLITVDETSPSGLKVMELLLKAGANLKTKGMGSPLQFYKDSENPGIVNLFDKFQFISELKRIARSLFVINKKNLLVFAKHPKEVLANFAILSARKNPKIDEQLTPTQQNKLFSLFFKKVITDQADIKAENKKAARIAEEKQRAPTITSKNT